MENKINIVLNKIIKEVARQKQEIKTLKRKITRLEDLAKTGKLKASYEYFEQITEDEILYFLNKFDISRKTLLLKLENILDYLKAHNKRYDNYRAFVSNWLRKDKVKELTSKEIEQRNERLKRVNLLKSKHNLK